MLARANNNDNFFFFDDTSKNFATNYDNFLRVMILLFYSFYVIYGKWMNITETKLALISFITNLISRQASA